MKNVVNNREMAETRTHVSDTDLVVKRRGGGSIVSFPPVFSPDAEILYVVWGNTIRAYSVQTGDFLLEFTGLSHKSCGIQLLPNSDTLATCSEQGEILFWDRKSATILEKRSIDIPPTSIVTGCHFLGREKDFFIVLNTIGEKSQKLWRYNPSCKEHEEIKMHINESSNCFAIGGQDNHIFLGAIYKYTVYALNVKSRKVVRFFVHSKRRYTCIAAHKKEDILAVGGMDGCITIWSSIFDKADPPRSIYHWHTLPVKDICFSEAGTTMLSGGGEHVLVKWTLNYQEKDFLPRMSAPINYLVLAPNNALVAASMEDNSIQLISPQLKVLKVIQNFSWSVRTGGEALHHLFINKIRFDPRTKCIVLNGPCGHLQFFSSYTNNLLYNLDVVGHNILTQERNTIIYNIEVTHVAFSCNGSWMATLEQRNDPDANLELRLKFWKFEEKKQNFALNTSIEYPHIGKAFALEMKPGTEDFDEIMAVTSGDDDKFKLWSLVDSSTIYGTRDDGEVWRCESIGTYKGLPAGDVGFSSDGSILGAAFSHALTLWITDTNELKSSLTHPDYQRDIKKVQFGKADCSHLVVCVLADCVVVWNLLSLTMTWTVPIELSVLVADPLSSYMAAFTCSGDLIVFKPSETKPVLTKHCVSEKEILLAAFVPLAEPRPDLMKWQQKSQLYFLNKDQELLVLESPDDEFKEGADRGHIENSDEMDLMNLTPFGRLLAGVTHTTGVEPVTSSEYPYVGVPGKKEIEELLRTPSHTMPPLRIICHSFLTSLIRKPGLGSKTKDKESKMEEDGGNDDKDSCLGSEVDDSEIELPKEKNEANSKDAPSSQKFVRPKIISTPELEARLHEVLQETTDWVEALF